MLLFSIDSNKMNEYVSITKLNSPSRNRISSSPTNNNANDQYFSTVAYANVDSGAIETNATDIQQNMFSGTNIAEVNSFNID